MNKLFLVLMLAVMALGLTACLPEEETPEYIPPYVEPGNTDPTPEEPVDETPVEETPVEEEPTDEEPVDETPVDEEPVEETPTDPVDGDEEPVDEQPVEEQLINMVLDSELRVKDQSHTVKLDVTNYELFQLVLTMTGSYDNPVTIKTLKLDGVEIDFSDMGLTKQAGEHINLTSGIFTFERATYYKGLRIKATKTEPGKLLIDLTGINEIEIELVFTTSANEYFDKVTIDVN